VAKLPVPLERDTQKTITEFLEARGAEVIRVNSGAVKIESRLIRFNRKKGCSDLLVCYHGYFLALEVKRPGKPPTLDQSIFLARVKAAGGIGAVVESVKDAVAVLDQLDLLDRVRVAVRAGREA
jgi:hypothetical protein